MSIHLTIDDVQPLVERSMQQWSVPGMGVAVVQDGQVTLCEGFGQRNLDRALPVTPQTLFPVASCTKAFTAACLGLLVEEGRLTWDTPLREYLPDFQLQDRHATELLTARDVLCHRSGLPAYDGMWYETRFTRRDIYRRLRYLEPSCSLRTHWQYQNMLYMVAGLLVEQLTGLTWEAFVQQRLFEPLSMARSNTATRTTEMDPDHSRPYMWRQGVLKEIPFLESGPELALSSAGAISSCAGDLARWLSLQINGGQADGQTLISREVLAELHRPQMLLAENPARQALGFEFSAYGLGWFVDAYQGQVLVWHDGETQGFTSMVSFVPRERVGVVVLSNAHSFHNPLPHLVTYSLYDRLLSRAPTDWGQRYQEQYAARLGRSSSGEPPAPEPRARVDPPRPLDDYLGDYEHPAYGVYSVRRRGPGLVMVRNQTVMPVVHEHDDVFEVTHELYDLRAQVTFLTGPNGAITALTAPLEPLVSPLVFKRT